MLAKLIICATAFAATSAVAMKRPEGNPLTQQYAAYRAEIIRNVKYEMDFQFTNDATRFEAMVAINFTSLRKSPALSIEFPRAQIASAEINGAPFEAKLDGEILNLPSASIKEGRNRLKFSYSAPFNNDGTGIYRFVDPEDKRVYLYTNFEPYDAHLLFPSFDQPDLKANYVVSVKAPKDWQVIANAMPSEVKGEGSAYQRWNFPETKVFSTYIFALHAGPYHQWEDKKSRIPSRLFARQSLRKYVDPEEWFVVTRQGFDYFENYFDFAYPFGKYDQIIVPDFNSGAMENVGAVTFSERFVARGKESESSRQSRAEVILHEMAHMWFGDVVTMRWWDDLWLNESFATFLAYKAAAEATEFKNAFVDFSAGIKGWAYWEDQLVTTHPILATVKNTDDAFTNFDGITYGKGASVLRQLSFLVGDDVFRNGVRTYLKDFAYKNTVLPDFMSHIEKSAKSSVSKWQDEWLKTSGPNTVHVDLRCDKDRKISRFVIRQRAPAEHPTLRNHRMRFALFSKQNEKGLIEYQSADITFSGAESESDHFKGQACPDFVLPNSGDYAYAKVRFDEKSKALIQDTPVDQFNVLHDRLMVYTTLWDMTLDAEYPLERFLQTSTQLLESEQSSELLEVVLGILSPKAARRRGAVDYLPEGNQAQKTAKAKWQKRIVSAIQSRLNSAKAESDQQKILLDALIRSPWSPQALEQVEGLLSGKTKLPGVKVDQDVRWDIVLSLSRYNYGKVQERIDAEAKKDPSRLGNSNRFAAESMIPMPASKLAVWEAIIASKDGDNLSDLRTKMRSLYPSEQSELKRTTAESFFKKAPEVWKQRDAIFAREFTSAFSPDMCEETTHRKLAAFLKKHYKDIPPSPLKELRVTVQMDQRCIQIRKLAAETSQQSKI